MSEAVPQYSNELNLELEKIQSPVERAAFEFFYKASAKEDFDMPPAYTWDKFDRGIAAFNGLPISFVDMVAGKFIPNYTEESCQENGLENVVPMLDALKGPFVQSVHKARQKGSVRIIANHPTIATPYLVARSLAEAYLDAYEEDIRPFIYVVEGAYPTVLKYRLRQDDGSVMEISPVDLGMSLANLLLTAPRTESTKSDDTAVKEWMRASRANFRVSNHEILLPSNPDAQTDQQSPGNIEIVIPSGRRAKKSFKGMAPRKHKEYMPDSSLDYITEFQVPTFLVGVDDNLLNNPLNPSSNVNIFGDPRARYLRTRDDVLHAISDCCKLASSQNEEYELEKIWSRLAKVGGRVIGHASDVVE